MRGYRTGGTVHKRGNNQVGFTTVAAYSGPVYLAATPTLRD